MTRKLLLMVAASGLLALASCGPFDSSTGELNNGRFSYLCVDSSDSTCEGVLGNAAIPDRIAVGGTFDLEYAGDTKGSAPVQVQPASETMISGASGNFKFRIPGIGAMLARNTSGVVADFVHLRGVAVDHLNVGGPSSGEAVSKVEMTTEGNVTLEVSARDVSDAPLAGALAYTWSSSDEKIVALGVQGPKKIAVLTGLAAGTATVEVTLPGGLKMAVLVTVTQGSNTTTSSGSGSSGTGQGGSGSSGSTTGAGGAGGGK
ncbi:MAG: hypothetical protein ABJE95_26970 [Byssovorax sp.]